MENGWFSRRLFPFGPPAYFQVLVLREGTVNDIKCGDDEMMMNMDQLFVGGADELNQNFRKIHSLKLTVGP